MEVGGQNYIVYSGLESHLIYKAGNPQQYSVNTNAFFKKVTSICEYIWLYLLQKELH